jgi:hypothetical protein
MLWKLFSSDEKVRRALEQSGKSYDLSPRVSLPANNDQAAPAAGRPSPNARLWLEDWSERDEARLQSDKLFWEGYGTKDAAGV